MAFGFSVDPKQQVMEKKAAPAAAVATSNPILTASNPGDPVQFDTNCVANPVVLPPADGCNEWQCYYYGNNGSWNDGIPSWLPTGSTGLAVSGDGITWRKVVGKEKDGAILAPSSIDSGRWDSVHTGVCDVVRLSSTKLHMYYLGAAGNEQPADSKRPDKYNVGLRMRIGRARSFDNGRTWTKDENYLLDYDTREGLFASWARIVVPSPPNNDNDNEEPWRMYYHSFTGSVWRVFGAVSYNRGDSWTRTGLVLEGDDSSPSNFDYQGIGTRTVCPWRDGYLMIYEGVDGTKGVHRLGAAFCSKDQVGAGSGGWKKLNRGKPILEPGRCPLGLWTNLVIGTPYAVNMPDGSLRLYHCAMEREGDKMSIGAVVSATGDIDPECWSPLA